MLPVTVPEATPFALEVTTTKLVALDTLPKEAPPPVPPIVTDTRVAVEALAK
jgi:hypothetical protein